VTIDAGALSAEELEALETENARRREALAQRIELEAAEHRVSRAPAPKWARGRETVRLQTLEVRLAAAEKVCELAELFDLRASESLQPTVDAFYEAIDAWRLLKGET
jgi:hypothetical protein